MSASSTNDGLFDHICPLHCGQCPIEEFDALMACPECFDIVCVMCLSKQPKSRPRSKSGAPSQGKEGYVAGVLDVSAACPSCKRKGDFHKICNVSAVVRRVCSDVLEGSGDASLNCVICGDRAFNNRTCPSCATTYCSICLDQWKVQCYQAGERYVSCANCRAENQYAEYTHDRFAAKLARLWPLDPDDAAYQQKMKKKRPRPKRKMGRTEWSEDVFEADNDANDWSRRAKRGVYTVIASKQAMMYGLPLFVAMAFFYLYCYFSSVVSEAEVHLLFDVALAKDKQGDLDAALKAYEELRSIRVKQEILDTRDGAMLLHNIGIIKSKQGEDVAALEIYNEARSIRQAGGSMNTPDGALLSYHLGATRGVLKDQEGSFQAYEEAYTAFKKTRSLSAAQRLEVLRALVSPENTARSTGDEVDVYNEIRQVLKQTGAADTLEDAMVLHNIGVSKGKHGDVMGALTAYQSARKIRERTATLDTVDGAHLMHNIGVTKGVGGETRDSIEAYEKAKRTYDKLGLSDSAEGKEVQASLKRAKVSLATHGDALPAGGGAGDTVHAAKVLHNIGVTKAKAGDLMGALDAYHRAKQIRIRTQTLDTLDGAVLLFNNGLAQDANGTPELAIDDYEQAWRIHRHTGTHTSTHGVQLRKALDRLKGPLPTADL